MGREVFYHNFSLVYKKLIRFQRASLEIRWLSSAKNNVLISKEKNVEMMDQRRSADEKIRLGVSLVGKTQGR